jgi:hypothetical protein
MKGMNTLAYYGTTSMTAIKSFIVLTPKTLFVHDLQISLLSLCYLV